MEGIGVVLPSMASVEAFLSQNLPVVDAGCLKERDAEFDLWFQQRTEQHTAWLEHRVDAHGRGDPV